MRSRDLLELLAEPCHSYYSPGGRPELAPESAEGLLKSANKAHDNIRQLLREKDQLRAALIVLRRKQRWQLKAFIALLGLTWSALGWILHLLIPYALRGMALPH